MFGAELSFAHQNEQTFEFDQDCSDVSHAFKRLLALRVTNILVKTFVDGRHPLSAEQLADKLQIPIRLVREIVDALLQSKIISEVSSHASVEGAYQPAQNIDLYTIKYVVDNLEHRGTDHLPIAESEELAKLSDYLRDLGKAVEQSPKNVLLKEI